MIGTTVGNYRVVEKLGDGGMGAVYRAVDEMLDREVAIKVLRPELARNAALIERFRLEAVALARLNHPRIATLHGLERHGESLLMIMEYVRGDTLEAIVQRSGRIAWGRACELCAAVLDALDHAHDKGVVHRDIKPANIMLASNGAVKVMDFGIARLMGKSRQTQVGHAVGTPMYMAPEQLRGEEVDGRTDLYAVGAVLFELVTGRMAFEADSDYGLMMKQLNDPPPAASSVVADVPPAVDAIIGRAMAKRRDDRFSNALAFRDELLAVAGLDTLPSRRTPAPAETRLAPSPPSDPARPAYPEARRAYPETRLADESPAQPAPSAPATRLVDDAPVAAPHATRLAHDAGSAADAFRTAESSRQLQSASAGWKGDWRTYATVAAVVVAAGLGVRMFRTPAHEADQPPMRPDSATVRVVDSSTTAVASNAITPVAPATRGEDAASLIINPPAPGGSVSPGPVDRSPSPPTGAPTPPRDRPSGGKGSGVEQPPPQRGESPSPVAPTDPVKSDPAPPRVEAPRTDVAESKSAAEDAIRDAIGSAASMLSGGNTAAASLLDGGVQEQWGALMREGRISMSVSGSPEVRLHGARATAEFDASVNVRSPFGANRRRSARFTAELQRGGGGWRVVGLRPQGKLELK